MKERKKIDFSHRRNLYCYRGCNIKIEKRLHEGHERDQKEKGIRDMRV